MLMPYCLDRRQCIINPNTYIDYDGMHEAYDQNNATIYKHRDGEVWDPFTCGTGTSMVNSLTPNDAICRIGSW